MYTKYYSCALEVMQTIEIRGHKKSIIFILNLLCLYSRRGLAGPIGGHVDHVHIPMCTRLTRLVRQISPDVNKPTREKLWGNSVGQGGEDGQNHLSTAMDKLLYSALPSSSAIQPCKHGLTCSTVVSGLELHIQL